jgi:hypothetical protein
MTQPFKPGEAVPRDGVYRVLHKNHREAHLNELRMGDTFPPCRQCGEEVRFELAPENVASDESETP